MHPCSIAAPGRCASATSLPVAPLTRPSNDRSFREYWVPPYFDELEQLGIVELVEVVEVHVDERHLHLAGEEHVLARLRHWTGGADDEIAPFIWMAPVIDAIRHS